ncbi:MAG: ESX secretion-associated protein EspG [Mycobacterium sp.]
MADLTTSPAGIWVLQALLGVETMPVTLGLRPYIPSVDSGPTVLTVAGERPLTQTAEYASLVEAGVIATDGRVDDAVRDWMTVVGRPDREVVVAIRRPAPDAGDTILIQERTLSVCRRGRWLAMIARNGDEIVLAPVGETASPDEQVALIADTVMHAFGDSAPAAIDGVNLPTASLRKATDAARDGDRWAVATALARLGLSPDQVAAVVAGLRLDESAMAVVSVVDHGVARTVHPEVLGVYDTDHGRFSLTNTTAPDRSGWTSIWPATPAALRQDLIRLLSVPQAAG